jgi:hypothetical protein
MYDKWSLRIFFKELDALYVTLSAGRYPLPAELSRRTLPSGKENILIRIRHTSIWPFG